MKINMKLVALIMASISLSVQAEGTLLRLYTDRDPGDTSYYVINSSSINYLQWDEDDKAMTIITDDTRHGESKFIVPIRSNEDAERFIEILMGKNTDKWLSADHK